MGSDSMSGYSLLEQVLFSIVSCSETVYVAFLFLLLLRSDGSQEPSQSTGSSAPTACERPSFLIPLLGIRKNKTKELYREFTAV